MPQQGLYAAVSPRAHDDDDDDDARGCLRNGVCKNRVGGFRIRFWDIPILGTYQSDGVLDYGCE